MTGLQAYQIYLSMRLHFTSPKFDITKTRVRRPTPEAFQRVKYRWTMEKMAKRYSQEEFISLLAANFAAGDKYGGMFNVMEADDRYREWMKRNESLTYRYKEDLSYLAGKVIPVEGVNLPDALWTGDSHPLIVREFLGHKIQIETLVILNRLYKFTEVVGTADPVLEEVVTLVRKYSPFVKADKEKFRVLTENVLDLSDAAFVTVRAV